MLSETDKPNSDILRRRHDTTSRHHGMHGHTARQRRQQDASLLTEIERGSPARIHRSEFEYLDAEKAYGEPGMSKLREPFKVTALELEGDGIELTVNRKGGWATVPKFLASHSVSKPAERKLRDGRVETSYELRPQGLILPDPKVSKAVAELSTHIYEIGRRCKPKLVTIVATLPPEAVTKPLLQTALHCAGCRVPQTAIVRCNQVGSAWLVERSQGKPLDIDLGMPCVISHFSTQGRHIPTRRYPHVERDWRTGQWCVEDAEYRQTPGEHQSNALYQGPWWTVRTTPEDQARGAYHDPMWVDRYELFWRADKGGWHSLGVFAGNSDETTEVVHSFQQVQGGLCARYLRVVPLESTNGGAMRVGVYGEPRAKGEARGAARRAGSRARAANVNETHDGEQTGLVEYRMTQVREGVNRLLARDGKGDCSAGCPCCRTRISKSHTRLRRRSDAHAAVCSSMCELIDEEDEVPMEWDDPEEIEHGDQPAKPHEVELGSFMPLHLSDANGRCWPACLSPEEQEFEEELQLALAISQSLAAQEEEAVHELSELDSEHEWCRCSVASEDKEAIGLGEEEHEGKERESWEMVEVE